MAQVQAQAVRLDQVAVPKPELTQQIYKYGIWAGFLFLLVWVFVPAEIHRFPELMGGAANLADLMGGFAEPNFRYWRNYMELIFETVQMAIWGSFLSVILSVPFGLMSSNNIAPAWPSASRPSIDGRLPRHQ